MSKSFTQTIISMTEEESKKNIIYSLILIVFIAFFSFLQKVFMIAQMSRITSIFDYDIFNYIKS